MTYTKGNYARSMTKIKRRAVMNHQPWAREIMQQAAKAIEYRWNQLTPAERRRAYRRYYK